MSNQTKQTQDQTQSQEAITTTQVTFANVKDVGLGTVISALNAVNNTARLVEHTTGILADKAERYREQVHIRDTITHNKLMKKLHDQAEEYGIQL